MTSKQKATAKPHAADAKTVVTATTQTVEASTAAVQPETTKATNPALDSSPVTAPPLKDTQPKPVPDKPTQEQESKSSIIQVEQEECAQANPAQQTTDLPVANEQKQTAQAIPAAQEAVEQPVAAEATKPAEQWFESTEQWHAISEAVVGLAHRDANPPLPCQDAALADSKLRPLVIVADGAGSSAVSEIGSQAVVSGLSRLLNTLAQQVSDLLDKPDVDTKQAHSFGLLLVKHALGVLEDLAVNHRRPLKDFRCTLLLAIQGQHNTLWVKIGDGALVAEHMQLQDKQLKPKLFTFGEVGKGEFANQTTFIDEHLQPEDVQTGLHPSLLVTGLAAMSDGAADRLVSNDGSRIAEQVASWFHALRQGKLKRRTLTRAFYADSFTKGTTGDDCSIALAACTLGVVR